MTWLEGRSSRKGSLARVGGAALMFAFSLGFVVPSQAVAGQSADQPAAASGHAPARRLAAHALQEGQQTFASAAEASQALVTALRNDDLQSLLRVLGPDAKDIVSSGDGNEDKNRRDQFVQKYQQMHRLVTEPDGTTTLYIGAENWPTPIPLVHRGRSWYFDTAAGKQEILYRRVGENELTVIHVCHELVDAQKEYYAQPRDGDSQRQYAQKILSDPGRHNGLYWKADSGEADSPLGPLVAAAEQGGYTEHADSKPQPFHGYYFLILKGQGPHMSGGTRSYSVDGRMTGGFAFLAYPAEYRSSGVMTFLVNQDGIVYQKDLGSKTAEIAKAIARYDRDSSWHKAD
jgi:Protein of unknown function (DUF2950)